LREEHSLRVFESRVLRKTSGATGDKIEVTGDQSRLHSEKIYNLYSSPNFLVDQITKDGMGCASGTYGGDKRCIQGLVGIPKGKRKLGRSKIHVCWL
jgi:hypothetical protein